MAHYFDDVFHRNAGHGQPKKPHMRRSSTARSISARSDFEGSMNGDDDDGHDTRSIGNSVAGAPFTDPERESQRQEADAHMHRYISEQLEKVQKDPDEDTGLVEEYETTA